MQGKFTGIFLLILYCSCSSGQVDTLEYLPTSTSGKIVEHLNFSLSYSEKHEQAEWIAYELKDSELVSVVPRSSGFRIDPDIETYTAKPTDYSNSAYAIGHLAPAKDMRFSETAVYEANYMSNTSPQDKDFNNGIWKKLEFKVRAWACSEGKVFVVTGPILSEGLPTIGQNKVSVPEYFYKIVLDSDPNQDNIKAIAFLIANSQSPQPLQDFVVTIDSLETLTGIDFFYTLTDEVENFLESKSHVNAWDFKATSFCSRNHSINSELNGTLEKLPSIAKSGVAIQCQGKTQELRRCKNRTTNVSGYCHEHEAQVQSGQTKQQSKNVLKPSGEACQCSGFTKSGSRCKRTTTNPNGKCWQH